MQKSRIFFIVGMIVAAAALRLMPHPPNFTPVTAMAIFGGAVLTDKRSAFLIPLAAMFISDLVLGFYRITPVVYGCFALNVCLGFWVRRHRNAVGIAGAAMTGSVLFFIVTNLGVWGLQSLYPKTLTGLEACFINAIPFFRNTLSGDLIYTLTMFGALSLAELAFPALRTSAVES